MENRVFCLGIVVGDFMGKPVVSIPDKGKLALTERTELHLGGCAANTSVVLKKLGVDVSITAKVGRDNLGDFIMTKLRDEGIDVRGIRVSDRKATSGSLVLIHPEGERSFIHSTGANGDLALEDIDFEYMKNFPLLHVAGAFLMPGFDGGPLASTLEKARNKGLVTCLDTAWDSTGRWLELVEESFRHVDYFLPSIEEARMITGLEDPEDIAVKLIDRGVGNVALKMGPQGSFIMDGSKESMRFGPVEVEVVDTTGSGDAYAAGFIAGIIKGLSFEKCGMLANLAGARTATAIGATSGVSTYGDLLEFGRKYGYNL